MKHGFLKRFFSVLRFDTHTFLFRFFEINSERMCNNKVRTLDEETRKIILSEDERFHHKDMILEELGSQYVVRGFTVDRIRFLRECGITPDEIIMDIGDSNGIFIRSLKNEGISLNISPGVALSLRDKNIETVIADAEYLPFKDRSISTILLFQTLEHVPNPVRLLKEIGRVCKKSLILSIPYVSETHIHKRQYDLQRPIYEHHIFEFSQPDFRSIVSHTPFTIAREMNAVVLDNRGFSADKILIRIWNYLFEPDQFCGCFMKFYLVHLKKTEDPEIFPEQRRTG